MASDPTDLIREADAALAQEAADEGGPIVDDPTTLVRHLRDALYEVHVDRNCWAGKHAAAINQRDEAVGERDRFENARAAVVVKCAEVTSHRDNLRRERDAANSAADLSHGLLAIAHEEAETAETALAEANATIERVQAIVDDPTLKDYAALAAVRRALAKREEP